MIGLYQRGSVWWLRFTYPGRGQVRVTTGETDEAEAIRFATRILDRPELLDFGSSFCAEVSAYVESRRKAGRSSAWCYNCDRWLQAAMRHLGQPDPRRVTQAQVQGWVDSLLRDRTPQTVATYHAALSRFFRWLASRSLIRRNPCDGVNVPRPRPAVRKRFLRPEEARKLLDACQSDGLKFALYCGLHAGLRKEEVIQSRPSWFDLGAGLLHVTGDREWHPKDRDNRTIPLTDEFKAWLEARQWPGPFMLAPEARKGKHRYRFDFRTSFRSLVTATELDGVTFHDLRRTFASTLVSRGVSLYKVAKWLGDGHAVVERVYGHLLPNDTEINKAAAQ